jgi:hypothetical protein
MNSRMLAPEIQETLSHRWEPMYRSQLHYLVTWSTRARRPVLKDRHVRALSHQVTTVCEDRGYSLLEVAAGPDHVHVLGNSSVPERQRDSRAQGPHRQHIAGGLSRCGSGCAVTLHGTSATRSKR